MTTGIALIALLAATIGGAAVHAGQDGGDKALPTCNQTAEDLWGALATASETWSPSGAPPEVSLRTLASGVLEELPPPPALLSLAQVQLPPGAVIPLLRARSPRLFVVESGTITMFWQGQESRLGPGATALVPLQTRFSVENTSTVPAQLLRLTIDSPNSPDVPVLNFDEVTVPPVPPDKRAVSTLLFRAAIEHLPPTPARLFVTCASWTTPPGEAAPLRHPGPVGLRMVAGSLRVDDGVMPRTLPAASCMLLDPRRSYQVQAGEEPPTAYLFGAIAEGQPLWLPGAAAPATPPQQVTCDPP